MTNGLITRRGFLVTASVVAAGGATAAVLARTTGSEHTLKKIEPNDGLIGAVERQRRRAGAVVKEIQLTPMSGPVHLGMGAVDSWSYDGLIPGSEVRLRAGDVLRATVRNELPDPTTIHWHGIALRNDMDGVPDLTQQPIEPGSAFTYEFTAPDPGTYFFHPHVGTQLDRGLYAALVVDDPAEPGAYDREFLVVLDDWLGERRKPDDVLKRLQAGMGGMSGTGGMGGMDMGGSDAEPSDSPLGADTGDVRYPMYLINGRPATDPAMFGAKPGERLRLRIINAGSDTPFRVALGGHRLTVTHSDGFPVDPVEVDALLLGMGERYDVSVRVPDTGAFPLVARAEGTAMGAMAVVRTGMGMAPMADATPKELMMGQLLDLSDLRATQDVALPSREPDRTYAATLTGDMASYRWGLDAELEDGVTLPVRSGERVRLVLDNTTTMWHPLHLHGHTFEVVTDAGAGPRKDTVIVPARARVTLDVEADNPGQWVLHCPQHLSRRGGDADGPLLRELSPSRRLGRVHSTRAERDHRPMSDGRPTTRLCPTGVWQVEPGEMGRKRQHGRPPRWHPEAAPPHRGADHRNKEDAGGPPVLHRRARSDLRRTGRARGDRPADPRGPRERMRPRGDRGGQRRGEGRRAPGGRRQVREERVR